MSRATSYPYKHCDKRRRFWRFVDRSGPHWRWLGDVDAHGRPFYVDPENPAFRGLALVICWEQMHPNLEQGERVRSNCGVKHCLTPDHLELTREKKRSKRTKQWSSGRDKRDASIEANREFDKLISK